MMVIGHKRQIGRALLAAVSVVVMFGGVIFMAGALAPNYNPHVMTENARGLLMFAGMCTLAAGCFGMAKSMEVK